ncbi:auxin-induced protein 6B-like [Phalaenopsis equestris]|uniref:auxin-induced protein 6B-like n=1 Tax=Phalaenopsis equestris TaxID=78828 RepID=UPI0009E1CA40|nr:auxin-induced protein 6B-like [Phalaenopsis equestris]
MDSAKSSNKITDTVALQQIFQKWKKFAITQKTKINQLKKTFSFSETSSELNSNVPKGYFVLCVGTQMKRFRVPMEFLENKAFQVLLQEAEEEFGFQNEGVLRIPCDVAMFENVVKIVDKKKNKVVVRQCLSEADLSHVCLLQEEMCW